MSSYIVDPLAIATDGIVNSLNSVQSITIATNGFIVYLSEEPVVPPMGMGGIGGPSKKFKKKKRITAIVQFEGVDYTETVETEDITIQLSDVKVSVLMEDNRPKIKIILD